MKKIGIILICFMIFITSCYKEDINPMPQPKPIVDIFTKSETSISNGEEIMFKLNVNDVYIIKLVDTQTNQVMSKEKITGKIGENKLRVYTKSLQSQYLYLVLEDVYKKEIKKTKININ